MKKGYHVVAIALFLAALFGVPASSLLIKDEEFSESENRYLSGPPAVSVEKILSGKWMEDAEEYVNEQFPLRNFWVSVQSDFRRLTGSKEINGVYLAEDGYLIEKWLTEELDEELLRQNIAALNQFAQQHPEQEISLMLVPTAGMVLRDKLPQGAPMFQQEIAYDMVDQELRDISLVDLTGLFSLHRTEDLYYKTDHHWTTYGAFLAYSAWCQAHGQTADLREFTIETVADSFQGTLHSKVLGTHCPYDRIDLYRRKNEGPYQVAYQFGKTYSDTVYAWEKLSQKDKYQVFLDGNYPEITINTSQKNDRHLLVIKASFANAFLPFLLNDYETIHVVDPRYYYGDLDQYILDHGVNECLILYNIKKFCEDRNISAILG